MQKQCCRREQSGFYRSVLGYITFSGGSQPFTSVPTTVINLTRRVQKTVIFKERILLSFKKKSTGDPFLHSFIMPASPGPVNYLSETFLIIWSGVDTP